MTTKYILISGSLRRESYNSAALRAVARIIGERPEDAEFSFLPIGEIPFYNGDLDTDTVPSAVLEARAAVAAADVVIISTPAYNGAVPGVLKNALDWVSRPYGSSAIAGKPVAVLSASPGARGAADAQEGLLSVLDYCDTVVVEHEVVAIGTAGERLDEAGEFTDEEIVAELRSLVEAAARSVGVTV